MKQANRRLLLKSEETLLSKSVSSYLTAILYLSGGNESLLVRGSELARHLRVSPPSITNMIHRLVAQKPSLIFYQEHRGVQLSTLGRQRALQLLRRHRLLTTFFWRIMGFPLGQLDEEADCMDHAVSILFEDRLAAKLGDPQLDPLGRCIPRRSGIMPKAHRKSCQCLARDSGCRV